MESSVIIPITFWNNTEPTFRISSIRVTPSGGKLVASSYDGELSTWNLSLDKLEITPRNILIGHTDPVTCLECTDDYAISTSEGGEICRWNLDDGYCTKSIRSVFVHRNIQLYKCSRLEDDLLFTCGDYHEIFVMHSVILHTIRVLHSKADSDWISCLRVMSLPEMENNVVLGMTKIGYIKLWVIEDFSDEASYEVESSLLPVKNVSQIKCSMNQTQILVISDRSWTIFDAKFLKTIYTANRICNETFIGGDFYEADVLIWTNECRFYLFKLEANEARLAMVFSNTTELPKVFEPAMCLHKSKTEKYLVQCDVSGTIAFWKTDIPNATESPFFTCKLSSQFSKFRSSVFDEYMKHVTCCIVITGLDLFAIGCSDGTIIVVPALQTISSYYFHSKVTRPQYKTLSGHKGRINCLLYPHSKYSHHNKSYLLSGGSDFSVCLWDISSFRLIHKFCVQSGEIIKLLVPPEECKVRVKNSVCSVANDHSVAILNLKELKCIVLASRQLFPVVTINWRPLDDFIIIECFDGTVYIWEMETGHLDRVLHGVTAQEVIYACKESNHEDVSNFYLRDDSLVGKDHFRRGLFQIEKDFHSGNSSDPITVKGFLDGFNSENQVIMFNMDSILSRLCLDRLKAEMIDPETYRGVQGLTTGSIETPVTKSDEKIKPGEDSGGEPLPVEWAGYLMSILHSWNDDETCIKIRSSTLLLKPEVPVQFGLVSESQNVSVFLSKTDAVLAPALNTYSTISVLALTSELENGLSADPSSCKWADSDLKLKVLRNECSYDPHFEALARLWQNKCLTVRSISRKLLLSKLQSQTPDDRGRLLQHWFKYLPHFPSVDDAPINKSDIEISSMRLVALVLFGVVGSDFRFKVGDSQREETYLRETCAAIAHALHDSGDNPELQAVATNVLGRGYAVWEQSLKFEKVFRPLFEMAAEYENHFLDEEMTSSLDRCLNAHEALKAIAIARTDAFMSCLTREITQIRNSQSPKTKSAFMEKSKTEIILVLTDLLERTPYIMMQHLSDVISIFIYCISLTHLKRERIERLVPQLEKFKQIHHCLATRRIAVGMHDGSVVIYDLKTLKTHRIGAHLDNVSAVMFSPDGKDLATYCCFENRLSFWHVFAGIFGHVNTKCIKTFKTNQVHDEDIRNHLEIGSLTWIDNKSVLLDLCDGTKATFHL